MDVQGMPTVEPDELSALMNKIDIMGAAGPMIDLIVAGRDQEAAQLAADNPIAGTFVLAGGDPEKAMEMIFSDPFLMIMVMEQLAKAKAATNA